LVLYNLLLLGFFFYGGRLVWRGFRIETPTAPVARPAGAIGTATAVREAHNEYAG
jgi:cytochrome d ubiquinol oxidase subunit I